VRRLLLRWPTLSKLQSAACRLELLSLGYLLAFDIVELECKHAATRRRLKARVQTRGLDFADLSASMCLQGQRQLERRCLPADRKRAGRCAVAQVRRRRSGKFRGCPTGGGGARRFAIGESLERLWPKDVSGKRTKLTKDEKSALFSQMHEEIGQASEELKRKWFDAGLAGTATHAVGHRSFGARASKRPRVAESSSDVAAAVGGGGVGSEVGAVSSADRSRHTLAVVLQERSEQALVAQIAAFQEKREQEEKELAKDADTVREYNSTRPSPPRNLAVFSCGGAVCGRYLPPVGGAPDIAAILRVVEVNAPGSAMSGKALARNPFDTDRKSLRKSLLEDWTAQHEGYSHVLAPPIPRASLANMAKVSPCEMAGFCLHVHPRGGEIQAMAKALEKGLVTIALKKGTIGRKSYDSGMLVVQIRTRDVADDPEDQVGCWLHVSFGNLNSRLFSVLPLTRAADDSHYPDGIREGVPLEALPPRRAINLWKLLSDVDGGLALDLQLWTLSSSSIRVAEFLPWRVLVVSLGAPAVPFWQVVGPRRLPVIPFRVQALPLVGIGGGGEADFLEQPHAIEDDIRDFDDDGDEVDGPIVHVFEEAVMVQEAAIAGILPEDIWGDAADDDSSGSGNSNRDSDSAAETDTREGVPGRPRRGRAIAPASVGGAASSTDPCPGPLPPPPPPPAADADRRGGRRGARYHSEFVLCPETGRPMGEIYVNPAGSLDAHCSRCPLRVNRMGLAHPKILNHRQGRPLGTLVAILLESCDGNQVAHRAKVGDASILTHARRLWCRAYATFGPRALSDELLGAEIRPPNAVVDVDGEPLQIA
jgi:hypothetical protein